MSLFFNSGYRELGGGHSAPLLGRPSSSSGRVAPQGLAQRREEDIELSDGAINIYEKVKAHPARTTTED